MMPATQNNPTQNELKSDDKIHVLFVDDETSILSSLQRLFRGHEYQVYSAESATVGLEILEQHEIQVIVSDMRMPGMAGVEFLTLCAEKWPQTARIVLTGHEDLGQAIQAINQGHIYRYLNKPWDEWDLKLTIKQAAEQVRLLQDNVRLDSVTQRQNQQLKLLNENLEQKVEQRTAELQSTSRQLDKAYRDLKNSYQETVEVFSRLADMQRNQSGLHGRRVAELSRSIASELQLDDGQINDIYNAALLHDIGHLVLPDELFTRPYSRLTENEKKELERHPVLAEAALAGLEPLRKTALIIRHHHERMDGRGYPGKIKGDSIPAGARILALTDAYDGLLSGTRTGVNHNPQQAIEQLRANCGSIYDSQIFKILEKFVLQQSSDSVKSVKEIMLNSDELRPGMKLTRDLLNADNLLLLTTGKILNESLIDHIRQFEHDFNTQYTLHVKN